jgi:predicted ribosome quality control (RQC) complex YloA/Tae2 family protein
VDAASLDRLIAELIPAIQGRSLSRLRSGAPHALVLELAGERSKHLWVDASRRASGIYLLEREETLALEERSEPPGRDRQALLLLRKHASGRRIIGLSRVRGSRTLLLDAGAVKLVLRTSGTPALTVVLEGRPIATTGEGAAAWPLPTEMEDSPTASAPEAPILSLPRPWQECRDRDLAPPDAVAFGPRAGRALLQAATWREAAANYLAARRRGARFELAQRAALGEARRELRRLERLEANLLRDEAGLPDAEGLRREGEALLASPDGAPAGSSVARVPDPYEPGRSLSVELDPRLSLTANADRLFTRARRLDRARGHVAQRLATTRRALESARDREARALFATDMAEIEFRTAESGERAGSGTRHYLTVHGLSVLVGRGGKENHRLTFEVARPEDLWLHARDVPGAHVIVRDNEGRAGPDDIREAAEAAAFFSDARNDARVDVHVTRRKHVRPARGGPGRVHVFHSDTIRVVPRDPEGRLRRR